MADEAGSSSTPALDKLGDYVRRKKQREKAKIKTFYVKRDVEKAHAQYLRAQKYSNLECNTWNGENQSTRTDDMIDDPDIRRRLTTVEADPYRKPSSSVQGRNSSNSPSVSRMAVSSPLHPSRSCPGSRNMTDEEIFMNTLSVVRDIPVANYFCPVEHCGAGFSTTKKLKNHLFKFDEHSPCHPYKHLVDLELSPAIKEYRCPTCYSTYKSMSLCMTHMMTLDHNILELYKPVGIAAYACPECFLIYTDARSCRRHIAETNHINYTYRFRDDPSVADPLLLSPAILEQYIGACRDAECHLECLHCTSILHSEKDSIRHHLKQQHTVMAFTEKSLADIFREFERKYTCACCQVLFKELPSAGLEAVHQCNDNYTGIIVENNCLTSTEFMLRLALHRPACTKSEFPNSLKTACSSAATSKQSNLKKSNLNKGAKPRINQEQHIVDRHHETGQLVSSVMDNKDVLLTCDSGHKNDEVSTTAKDFDSVGRNNMLKRRRLCETDQELLAESKTVDLEISANAAGEDNCNTSSGESILPKEEMKTEFTEKAPGKLFDNSMSEVEMSSTTKHSKCRIKDKERHMPTSQDMDLGKLDSVNHVIFLDLDDCSEFFQMLPCPLPTHTFVWAFYSIKWEEPTGCQSYEQAVSSCSFHIQRETKRDSVHIKMALTIGRMDERLPKSTTFSIISNDEEFCEQLELSERCIVCINMCDQNPDDMCALLYSMSDR